MKKTIYILFMFLTLKAYDKINLHENSTYNYILETYGLKNHNNYMIEPDIIFYGWSKSGLIAYAIERPNETGGESASNIEFIIQNTRTDKVIKKITWRYDLGNLEKAVNIYSDKIYQLIKRYQIEESNHYMLEKFPIISSDKQISVTKDATYKTDRNYDDKFLTNIKFFLETKYKYKLVKEKTIYTNKVDKSFHYYDFIVLGYIKSPFKKSISILVAKVYRGWEYQPHVVDLEFIGALL